MRTRQFPSRRSTPPFRRMTWARFRVQFVAPPRQRPYHLHFGGSDFLEVFLPGQHQQLLHLLSDRPISLVHSEVADAAIPLPVRRAS